MERADKVLVERGLATTRSAAQRLIDEGRVWLRVGQAADKLIDKASSKVPATAELVVQASEADRYVSRGGLKLAGALAHCGLVVTGYAALDVGISTGGFTDCLLQQGAKQVVGIDVGHGQLAARLLADPRVTLFEGVNARAPDEAALIAANGGQRFDIAVCDVSFISLTLVLPAIARLLQPNAAALLLVKPQFEVGREGLGGGGIVRNANLYPQVEQKIRQCAAEHGLHCVDYFASPIAGGDGNREFFLYARRIQAENV